MNTFRTKAARLTLYKTLTDCTLFRCLFDGRRPMTIRWYFAQGDRLPQLRMDWGDALCGLTDDEAMY